MAEKCAVCHHRRAKRHCPALREDICPQCCGQEREETIACPLDCDFLRQGRQNEKLKELSPAELPHPEIVVPERFLREQELLVLTLSSAFAEGMQRIEGLLDSDAREALDSLVRTYKTLESGLIYESKPSNPMAAALHELIQLRANEFRQRVQRESGVSTVLDSHILGSLVFLQRMALQLNNGRRRGRSFLDAVLGFAPPNQHEPQISSPNTLLR